MKKFMNFLDKIFKDPKTNVFFIIFFGFFATTEFIAGNFLYAFLDFCIVIMESFNLMENCSRKEEEKINK